MASHKSHRPPTSPDTLQPATESIPFLAYRDSTRDVELGNLPADSGEHAGSSGRSSMETGDDLDSSNSALDRGYSWDPNVHSARAWPYCQWIGRLGCGLRERARRRLFPEQRTSIPRRLLRIFSLFLILLGLLQILALLLSIVTAFFPSKLDHILATWRSQGDGKDRSSRWPTDYTADIIPIKCHSHNDYWRTIPLISAIKAGCTSVEADVWLLTDSLDKNSTAGGPELYVGHSRSSLTSTRTLSSLYIDPLLNILSSQNPITDLHPVIDNPRNGIYDTSPSENLVLLIDFKTDGLELWPVVLSQLEPLRAKEYLTYFDGSDVVKGPLTVVVTGNAPFHKVIANATYRDVFFDAPLNEMGGVGKNLSAHESPRVYNGQKESAYLASIADTNATTYDEDGPHLNAKRLYIYNSSSNTDTEDAVSSLLPSDPTIYNPFNSYYASTSLQQTIGVPFPYINSLQRQKIQSQIDGAHSLGLMVRYWDTPAWPISWRNYIWRELMKMGIDYLNVDDLEAASTGEWKSQGSFGKLVWGSLGW